VADTVLVAVSGPAETLLVQAAEASRGRVVVVRRCADSAELLAAAAVGLGRVAVCAAELPGLDRDTIAALQHAGVRVLLLTDPARAPGRRMVALGPDRVAAMPGDPRSAGALVDEIVDLVRARPADGPPAAGSDPPSARPAGALIAVWGPTGAPGRTSIAINLAAELAASHGTTLLADADTYGGSVAQLVGLLDEAPGLAAAARAAGQGVLDLPALARLAPVLAPELRLLSGITRADRWGELPAAALDAVWAVSRRLARWVVVDTGFSLEQDEVLSYDTRAPQRNAATLSALTAADLVVVVGAGDPVGMQRLVRGLSELTDAGIGRSRTVVVNRVRASVAGPRPARAVREALARYAGVNDVQVVPEDGAAFDAAVRDGRTVREVAAGSAGHRALVELTEHVVVAAAPLPVG
jgi:MinD-like ATPase involved in chromosome partitioning or flagellar assembly